MKKIIYLLILNVLLSSCTFLGHKIEKENNTQKRVINQEDLEKKENNTQRILTDKEKLEKKENDIKKRLIAQKNADTKDKNEFISYCEDIKKSTNMLEFLNKGDDSDNNDILKKMQLFYDGTITYDTIEKYLNGFIVNKILTDEDKDQNLYVKFYLELINKGNIDCKQIFLKYYVGVNTL